MADPLSIIASCAGVATACMQSAEIIGKFISGVKNVDENVCDFQREVRNLASITDGVRSQLEKPGVANAMKAAGTANESDANLWHCISRTLQDCEYTTQKLRSRLQSLDVDSRNLLRPVIATFKLNSIAPDINIVRSQIQSYHGTLSIALQMTSLSIQIQDRESSQQSAADLLANLNGLNKQIGKLESRLEASRGIVASGDTTFSRASTEVNEENLKIFTNMFETVQTAEAFVSSASVALATGMRSTVFASSEYGVALSEERRADIDRWVPPPSTAPSTANMAEAIAASPDESISFQRYSGLQATSSLGQPTSRVLSITSTAATSESNRETDVHTSAAVDDDLHSDLELMVRLFNHGKQSHLQGDEQMAAVSFRQAFEQMTLIKPQTGHPVSVEDATLNLAFLTLDHHVWEVRLQDFEPLMTGDILPAPHRSRAKHLVAHHLLRSGRLSDAKTLAKSAKREWEKILASIPNYPAPRSYTFDRARGAKYPAIFKRGYEDVHRLAFADQGPDTDLQARKLRISGTIHNFSCYMYATEDIPTLDNIQYLRWAYFDTLSLLVRILVAKGESAEASVWLEDIPQDFYRPGEFDFIRVCDSIECMLCSGDKEGAERVGLSHLRSMLGGFKLSLENAQSISDQIRKSEGRGFAGFHDGYTALHALAECGRLSSIRILLSKGCNPRPTGVAKTPFLLAASNSHYLPARLFGDYKNGIRPEDARKGLAYAIHNQGEGACDFAEYLISRFDIVNAPSYHDESRTNMPPLHRAISQSNIAMVNLLLKQTGIDTRQTNPESGETPLWMAARRGQIAVIKLLVANSDSPKAQGPPQQTIPLMAAICARAVTVKGQMGAVQIDPLNPQSIDLLKRSQELLSIHAVRDVVADDKIFEDWNTIQEALKYLADNRPKENPIVRDVIRILLGAYNMPDVSDEELKDIIQRTKKFKNLENLSRRSSSTSLKNPFKRRTSQPQTSPQPSPLSASKAPDIPPPPKPTPLTKLPSRPAPPGKPSIPEDILKSFARKYLGDGDDDEPMQIVHG
jgi:ankyrin repeat protein